MNGSDLFDQSLFKDKFKNIFNKNSFTFPINNNYLSNIINKWKNSTTKFKKYTIFENKYDKIIRLILILILMIKDNFGFSNTQFQFSHL